VTVTTRHSIEVLYYSSSSE